MIQLKTYDLGRGGPAERLFPAKSYAVGYVLAIVGAFAAGGFAAWLGFDPGAAAVIHVPPDLARQISWFVGGVAVLVAVGACWEWHRGLRWIAVGRDGIRWFKGRREHTRAWNEVAKMVNTTTKVIQDEKHVTTWYHAELRFHSGPPLLIGRVHFTEYDSLLAAIELAAGQSAPRS
jgi:hypothetical protein